MSLGLLEGRGRNFLPVRTFGINHGVCLPPTVLGPGGASCLCGHVWSLSSSSTMEALGLELGSARSSELRHLILLGLRAGQATPVFMHTLGIAL